MLFVVVWLLFSYLAVSWTRTLSKVYRVTYIQGILILRAFRCSFTWILSFPSLAQIGEYTLDAGVPFLVRVAIEYNEQWTTNVCWMMLCNLCKSALRSVLTTTDFVSTCCDPWLSHELFHSPPNFLSLSHSISIQLPFFFLAWHTNIQECKTFFATSYKVPFSLLVMVFSFGGEYAIVCYTILKEMTCFDGTDAKRQNLSVWKEGHTNVYSVTKNVCNFSM